MARSTAEIKREITQEFIQTPAIINLYGLNVDTSSRFEDFSSPVSLESIFFYVVAACFSTVENLFNVHLNEISTLFKSQKPHTRGWYAERARAYQHGFDLLPDSVEFNNSGSTEMEIENSKIVKFATVLEMPNRLRFKIAGENADQSPRALDASEQAGFLAYINQIRDAGVPVELISDNADLLRISLTVYYNPLVMNQFGRLKTAASGAELVRDAVIAYFQSIDFNGDLIKTYFIDYLQNIQGVRMPVVNSIDYKTAIMDGFQPFTDEVLKAYAGYFSVENLTINYIPY